MNFYQSSLRREINQNIYQKPTFEVSFLGKSYFGIVKTHQRLGQQLRRYMIHGIEGVDGERKNTLFVDFLDQIKRDYGNRWGNIFFQYGLIDVVQEESTSHLKKNISLIADLQHKRREQNVRMRTDYGLLPSWREHMPDTTIIIDISKGIQDIRRGYSKSCKRYINKAKRENLSFVQAEVDEIEPFRKAWYTMAYDKGFAIVSLRLFKDLCKYLFSSGNGRLFVAKKEKKIVCGSVVLKWENTLIYLYGATDRSFGDIGAHYRLTDQIMRRGSRQGYMQYDLLGVAPIGETSHYLSSVTRFKQSFGGTTIQSVGSYDFVYNSILYRMFQIVKTKSFGTKR